MLEFISHCLYRVIIDPLQEVKHTPLGALGSRDAEHVNLCVLCEMFSSWNRLSHCIRKLFVFYTLKNNKS